MQNVFSDHVAETKQHLGIMMAKERKSGDFLLASVVQDSLLYNLHQHANSQHLMDIAHAAAQISIQSAIEHMTVNEFTIRESVRGVMHSMVSLGGNPTMMSVAVSTGAVEALSELENNVTNDYTQAVIAGICSAVEDMGIDSEKVRRTSGHVICRSLQQRAQ